MPAGYVDRHQGTGDFLIMFFFDPVEVKVNGGETPLHAGSLMVWQPGSYQYYGSLRHGYVHSWVHCCGEFVRERINACGIRCDSPIPGVNGTRFEHHLKSIHFECGQTTQPDRRIIENHISNLIYEIQRAGAESSSTGFVPAELLSARQHIEAHYSEHLSLPDLACIANVSPQHFCKQFRKVFGAPPIEYLLRFRLAQAAYFLLDRNMRIGEISRRVGIEDIQYFSKLFKKRYGKSPRQMREESVLS